MLKKACLFCFLSSNQVFLQTNNPNNESTYEENS